VKEAAFQQLQEDTHTPIGYVHEGFSRSLDAIWDKFMQAVRSTRRPIFLSGHSLGGALATLAAFRLMQLNDPDIEVRALYTYGSPRVGDPAFVEAFNRLRAERGLSLRRYVNNNDIFVMVPNKLVGAAVAKEFGQLFLNGWSHVGLGSAPDDQLVWFADQWKPFRNEEAQERMNSTGWIKKAMGSPLRDHQIVRYAWKAEIAAFGNRTRCPSDTSSAGVIPP